AADAGPVAGARAGQRRHARRARRRHALGAGQVLLAAGVAVTEPVVGAGRLGGGGADPLRIRGAGGDVGARPQRRRQVARLAAAAAGVVAADALGAEIGDALVGGGAGLAQPLQAAGPGVAYGGRRAVGVRGAGVFARVGAAAEREARARRRRE